MIWAFAVDSMLTAVIGFGSKEKTAVFVAILIVFLAVGALLYSKTQITLKRKEFEESSTRVEGESPKKVEVEMEMGEMEKKETSTPQRGDPYLTLN